MCEQVRTRRNTCACDCMTVGQSAAARDCAVAQRQWMMGAVVTHEAWDQL